MLHSRAGRPDALVLGAEHCGCAESALALKCAKSPAKGPRLVGALDCKPLPARVSWLHGRTTRGNAVAHHSVQHTRGASPAHNCPARCAIPFPGHPSVNVVAGHLHAELVHRVIAGPHSLALNSRVNLGLQAHTYRWSSPTGARRAARQEAAAWHMCSETCSALEVRNTLRHLLAGACSSLRHFDRITGGAVCCNTVGYIT